MKQIALEEIVGNDYMELKEIRQEKFLEITSMIKENIKYLINLNLNLK